MPNWLLKESIRVFAVDNADLQVRNQSSTGGIFSILAKAIIKKGGVVNGAAFDSDWDIVHRRVDDIDVVAPLRSSKYAYSKVGASIADAIADLASGREVLFSGTPGQVAAMRKRFGNNPNLFLVEVVCHGAPEQKYWNQYIFELCAKLHRSKNGIASINFRDKRTDWKNYIFTVTFNDGKAFSKGHVKCLYLRAFIKNYTLRDACFRCPSKYPSSTTADITIGDLWGIAEILPQRDNDLGTSAMLCRTTKDISALSEFSQLDEVDFDKATKHNQAIISSPAKSRISISLRPVARKVFSKPVKNRIHFIKRTSIALIP